DGIRDFHVTGVQTCALPILRALERRVFLVGALALLNQQLFEAAHVIEVGVGLRLLRLEALLPRQQLLEVDLVRVEIGAVDAGELDRKSTRLNSSHVKISYAV